MGPPEEISFGFPDQDLDDVSVTSTRQSEEQDTYELEEILAEDTFEEEIKDGETGQSRVEQFQAYLIKWTGYDIHEANYERKEQLAEGYEETVLNWQTRKMRISRGLEAPFDVDAWEEECRDINCQRYMRHKKRYEKRRRLHLPLGDDPDKNPLNTEFVPNSSTVEDSSDDEAPLVSRRKRAVSDESSDDDTPMAQKRRKDSFHELGQPQDGMKADEERRRKKGQAVKAQKPRRQMAREILDHVDHKSSERPPVQKVKTFQPATTPGTSWFDVNKAKLRDKRTANASTNQVAPPNIRPQSSANGGILSQTPIFTVPQNKPKMGPTSHVGKKPGSIMRRSAGPSILDNWDSKRPEPKRKLSAMTSVARAFPTLQIQNVVRKATRKDTAPSLEESQSLSTGRRSSVSNDQIASPRTNGSGNGIQNKLTSLGLSTNDSHVTSSHSPSRSAEFSTEAIDAHSKPSDPPLLSCYFWALGNTCVHGRECPFEHSKAHQIAPVNNRLDKDQATCFYWFSSSGGCNKGAETCKFSHRVTRYLGPQIGKSGPRRLGLSERPYFIAAENDSASSEPKGRPYLPNTVSNQRDENPAALPGKQNLYRPPENARDLGCWYFNFNPRSCVKKASECKFLHEIVPWVAGQQRSAPVFNTRAYNRPEQPLQVPNARQDGVPAGQGMDLDEPPTRDSPTPHKHPSRRDDSGSGPTLDSTFAQHIVSARPSTMVQTESDVLPIRMRLQLPNQVDTTGNLGIDVSLSGFTDRTKAQFVAELDRCELPPVSHICTAEDMTSFFTVGKYRKYADGEISGLKDSSVNLKKLEGNLRALQAAAVIFHPQFSMFIYPIGSVTFGDLFNPSSEGATLRFYICSTFFPPPLEKTEGSVRRYQMPEHLKKSGAPSPIAGLSSKLLFSWGTGETEKNAFLVFHRRHEDVASQIQSHLQQAGAKVYRSSTPGAWNYFSSQKRGGVVIFQSGFDAFDRMESFSRLTQTASGFNFFRLTAKPASTNLASPVNRRSPMSPTTPLTPLSPFSPSMVPPHSPSAPQSEQNHLERIFAHGLAIYIMDDCLVYQPHDTRPAVEAIQRRLTSSLRTTRILGRPGFLPWLSDLAVAEEHDIKSQDRMDVDFGGRSAASDRPKAEIYSILATINNSFGGTRASAMSPFDSEGEDEERKPVCAIPASYMPDYAGLWARDETAASNRMAEWFAGWSLQEVAEIRRFVVLSMVSSGLREEWKRKYKHLSVMTPGDFVRQEGKAAGKKK